MKNNTNTVSLTQGYQWLLAGLVWLLCSSTAWANGDQLLGVWLSPDDKATIEIYQQDGKYSGRGVTAAGATRSDLAHRSEGFG